MPQKNKLTLAVQYPDPRLKDILPRTDLRRWVQAALFAPAELTIRIVDAEEGRTLNRDYRHKDYATNVLTFAYTEDEDEEVTRADIILCTDVLQREAAEQHKTVQAHAAHLGPCTACSTRRATTMRTTRKPRKMEQLELKSWQAWVRRIPTRIELTQCQPPVLSSGAHLMYAIPSFNSRLPAICKITLVVPRLLTPNPSGPCSSV